MVYNNGFPVNYQYPQYTYAQPQVAMPAPAPQQHEDTGIKWVQGEAGAKSWAVAPNQSVMLMDSEKNVFYIKTTDGSGMPMPLRIFDYTERTQVDANTEITPQPQYVTKQELEDMLAGFVRRKEFE